MKLFIIIIFPVPPTKSNFKQSKCILDTVLACLPPQVFKVYKVLGNNKRRKFRIRGCCSPGAIKLQEKQGSFSQKISVCGKSSFSLKRCSQGKSPNTSALHSAHESHSSLESLTCLLFFLNKIKVVPCFLLPNIFQFIFAFPVCHGSLGHPLTNSSSLPLSMAFYGASIRSLAFQPLKPSQDPFLL